MRMSEAICCTWVNCNCQCFKPGKINQRQCDQCRHGWVTHALSKLRIHHLYQNSQVEIVQSNVVFDIGSLILYGTQAIPVRLKILLDRLFSVLKQEEVIQILHSLGWTLQDYIRGYILQDVTGKVLDRWTIMTFEEELATLQQFLRFGETKSIVELMAIQDKEGQAVVVPSTRTNSDIRTFIENSNQSRSPSLSTNVEKVNLTNIHHFETIVNNVGFMLPFQFFSPVPPPLIGSPPDKFLIEQSQSKVNETKQDIHILSTESSQMSTISTSFNVENEMNTQDAISKEEADDLASDSNALSCHSLCTVTKHEMTQISPENRFKSIDRNGTDPKKGRVFCTACEKTFYDKGTLKIHYNAVHLKIKHRCIIDGCNMVFSSLRSRNRHSSNPNPRLHMPMNRNNRDKDLRNVLPVTTDNDKGSNFVSITAESKPISSYSNLCIDSKVQPCLPSVGQNGILYPNLKTVQPVLPFYRSQVTTAELGNTSGTFPSLPQVSSPIAEQPIAELSSDAVPKKKSRKSSMPIKIEKGAVETVDDIDDVNSVDGTPVQLTSSQHSENCSQLYENKTKIIRAENNKQSSNMDKPIAKVEGQKDIQSDNGIFNHRENLENECRLFKNGYTLEQKQTVNMLTTADTQEESMYSGNKPNSETHIYAIEQSTKKMSCSNYNVAQHSLQNEGLSFTFPSKTMSNHCFDGESKDIDPIHQHFLGLDKEESPHHCEICKKTFKNPYSVKMHYQNVHLKQMHICTVEGCSAAFPSRRSRDRHSANINLHHKILTKDPIESESSLLNATSLLKDMATDFCQAVPVTQHIGQTSVIFKGMNRTGSLVFPMSKTQDYCSINTFGGDDGENSTVLDLSTTSSMRSGSSVHSSWDSDEGSEEVAAVDDSDESCDGPSLLPREESYHNLNIIEKANHSLKQHLPPGLPITCHICQKLYSNKGTFRAHYKTVHLRQLHKCKVAGCNTMFSSVRSRNRHSQNPNLHKNLSSIPNNPQ